MAQLASKDEFPSGEASRRLSDDAMRPPIFLAEFTHVLEVARQHGDTGTDGTIMMQTAMVACTPSPPGIDFQFDKVIKSLHVELELMPEKESATKVVQPGKRLQQFRFNERTGAEGHGLDRSLCNH